MSTDTVDGLLLFPPLVSTALTGPPLGIQHLAAYAEAQGFRTYLLDLNIAFARELVSSVALEALRPEAPVGRARIKSALRVAEALRLDDGAQILSLCCDTEVCATSPLDRFRTSAVFRSLEKAILDMAPRVVGVSILCAEQVPYALAIARALRKITPTARLVAGGPEVTFLATGARGWVEVTQAFDVVVRGDGETALIDVLRGQQLAGIIGPRKTPLCQVPLEAAFVMDIHAYAQPRTLNIVESTGCYWNNCTHCDYIALHESVDNSRSIPDLVEVLTEHAARTGTTRVHLVNDTLAPARARKFAAEIARSKSAIRWNCFVKIDRRFSREILDTLREGGCDFLVIGLESLSDGPLATLAKGYTASEALQWMDQAGAAGVALVVNLIVGIPGSTASDDEITLRALERFPELFGKIKLFRFVLSSASAMGRAPQKYGLVVVPSKAKGHRGANSVAFVDDTIDSRETSFRAALSVMARKRRLSGRVGNALLSLVAKCPTEADLQIASYVEIVETGAGRAILADAVKGISMEVPLALASVLKAMRETSTSLSSVCAQTENVEEAIPVLIELAGSGVLFAQDTAP